MRGETKDIENQHKLQVEIAREGGVSLYRFDIVVESKVILGESPVWDEREERLYWIDGKAGLLFRSAPNGSEQQVWKLPSMCGSFCLRESGGGILTLEDGIYLIDLESGEIEFVADPEPHVWGRFNDGKVDRQGRFVTGSIDFQLMDPKTSWLCDRVTSECSLYRVNKDLTIDKIKDDVAIANGPAFSPNGETFYLADSWKDCIYAYDYDTQEGTLSGERVFASYVSDKTATGAAQPDGATVDDEGYVWSVAVFGGEIRRYAPDGTLDRRIQAPVLKPTSLVFGGTNLDILYVTSMANSNAPNFPPDGPLAGSVFALSGLGVRGIPETRFAG